MISLRANGNVIKGFSGVRISRSLEQFCATYSLQAFPQVDTNSKTPAGAWLPTFPEDLVEICIDDEVVVKGYNDECRPAFSAGGASFSVSGREISKDIVDCFPENVNFENKKVDEIARLICNEFGVNFRGAQGVNVGAPLSKFSGDSGRTAYEVLLNACKQRRCMPSCDGLGNVSLVGAKYQTAQVDLTQGINVLQAQGVFSTKRRYKVYRVVASNDFSGKTFAEVVDDESSRARRWVMLDERWSTKECCEGRAMWEAKHQQAVANALQVSVNGWRQKEGGALWMPGLLVHVDLPAIIGDAGEFLVNKVDMSYDVSNGAVTTISLVDPEIYSPLPGFPSAKKKVKAKNDVWANIRKQTGSTLR